MKTKTNAQRSTRNAQRSTTKAKRSLAAHKANWTRKLTKATAPAMAAAPTPTPPTRWVIVARAGELEARSAAWQEVNDLTLRGLVLHHYRIAAADMNGYEHLLRDYGEEESAFDLDDATKADTMAARVIRRLELIRGLLRDAKQAALAPAFVALPQGKGGAS